MSDHCDPGAVLRCQNSWNQQAKSLPSMVLFLRREGRKQKMCQEAMMKSFMTSTLFFYVLASFLNSGSYLSNSLNHFPKYLKLAHPKRNSVSICFYLSPCQNYILFFGLLLKEWNHYLPSCLNFDTFFVLSVVLFFKIIKLMSFPCINYLSSFPYKIETP